MKNVKREIDELKEKVERMSSDIEDIKQLLESVAGIVKEDHNHIKTVCDFKHWFQIIRSDIQIVLTAVNRILYKTF